LTFRVYLLRPTTIKRLEVLKYLVSERQGACPAASRHLVYRSNDIHYDGHRAGALALVSEQVMLKLRSEGSQYGQ
jgi:hypothetical protein